MECCTLTSLHRSPYTPIGTILMGYWRTEGFCPFPQGDIHILLSPSLTSYCYFFFILFLCSTPFSPLSLSFLVSQSIEAWLEESHAYTLLEYTSFFVTTDFPTPSTRLLTFLFNSTFIIILDFNIPMNNPSNVLSLASFDLLNSRDHFLPQLSAYSHRSCKLQHPFQHVNLTHPVLWPSSPTVQHTSTTVQLPSYGSLGRPTLSTLTHTIDPTTLYLHISPNHPAFD